MKPVNQIKLIGETCLGVLTLMTIIFSIINIAAGDHTGIQLLFFIGFLLLLMWLGWSQPVETGSGLVVLGIFIVILFNHQKIFSFSVIIPSGLIFISGFMFVAAYFLQKKHHQDI